MASDITAPSLTSFVDWSKSLTFPKLWFPACKMDILTAASQWPWEDMVAQWIHHLARYPADALEIIPALTHLCHYLPIEPQPHLTLTHTWPGSSLKVVGEGKSSKVTPVWLTTSKIKINNSNVFKWELEVIFLFRFHLKITNYKIVAGKGSC